MDRATIWSYSQRDLAVPDFDKNVLAEINTTEQARAALDNAGLMGNLELSSDPAYYQSGTISYHCRRTRHSQHYGGTKEEQLVKIESFYGMYDEDTSFGKMLRPSMRTVSGVCQLQISPRLQTRR